MTCPLCHHPLRTWYSLSKEEAVCICPNLECKASRLRETGNSTVEAIKNFNDKCFRLDGKAMKSKFEELRKVVENK